MTRSCPVGSICNMGHREGRQLSGLDLQPQETRKQRREIPPATYDNVSGGDLMPVTGGNVYTTGHGVYFRILSK